MILFIVLQALYSVQTDKVNTALKEFRVLPKIRKLMTYDNNITVRLQTGAGILNAILGKIDKRSTRRTYCTASTEDLLVI